MYEFFQGLFQYLLNAIVSIANVLIGIPGALFNAFKSFMVQLFGPILLLFQGIWYLITSIFNIVILVVQVILGLFYVAAGVIGGIFSTFSQLMGFSGNTAYYNVPSAYSQGFSAVANFFSQTGFSNIAYIAAVFVWMLTAYAVIRIAGGER